METILIVTYTPLKFLCFLHCNSFLGGGKAGRLVAAKLVHSLFLLRASLCMGLEEKIPVSYVCWRKVHVLLSLWQLRLFCLKSAWLLRFAQVGISLSVCRQNC